MPHITQCHTSQCNLIAYGFPTHRQSECPLPPRPLPLPAAAQPKGTFTTWQFECEPLRPRCVNLALASRGYQVRNAGSWQLAPCFQGNELLAAGSGWSPPEGLLAAGLVWESLRGTAGGWLGLVARHVHLQLFAWRSPIYQSPACAMPSAPVLALATDLIPHASPYLPLPPVHPHSA